MFLFYLKKVLVRALFPVPLIGIVLAVGVWLVLSRKSTPRRRTVGKCLLIGGLALYYLVGVCGWMLLQPLILRYPPLNPESLAPEPYLLAVAGSGFLADDGLPDDCRFNDAMTVRLHEAARIAHVLERRGIPYTVAVAIANPDASPERKRTAAVAFLAPYGVPQERVRVIEGALNSRQEVRAFLQLPGRPILISEAFHVPRLMILAAHDGVADAIAAPAGLRSGLHRFRPTALIPSGENFNDARRAVYEYLGIVEAKMF